MMTPAVRTSVLSLLAAFGVVALATPAAADTRYFSYEASGQAARHRTGDVTLEVRTPMLFFGSTRVRSLWRRRGSDLPLGGPVDVFRREAVAALIGGSADGVTVYPVQEEAGRGFSQGACDGAPRSWVAMAEPRAYRPLRLWVLRQGQGGQPELCETLDYTWRAEWVVSADGTRPENPGPPNPY